MFQPQLRGIVDVLILATATVTKILAKRRNTFIDGCQSTGAVVDGNGVSARAITIPPALATNAPSSTALRIFTAITLAEVPTKPV